MPDLWYLEFGASASHLSLLSYLDILPFQTKSWLQNRDVTFEQAIQNRADLLVELLIRSGLIDSAPYDLSALSIEVTEKIDDLVAYSEKFLSKAVTNFADRIEINKFPSVIILNLMPFVLSKTIVDKIILGFRKIFDKHAFLSSAELVFFTREHFWITDSIRFKQNMLSPSFPNKVCIVDLEGIADIFVCEIKDGKKFADQQRKEVRRSSFEKVLHFRNEREFRKALVYETNLNIGHFILSNSHVRTHYDLEYFVKRDNVFEYIFKKFATLFSKFKRITLIAEGLETWALTMLGNRLTAAWTLESDAEKNISIDFQSLSGAQVSDDTILRWIENSDCILILTDIINTGATVKNVIKKINNVFDNYKSTIQEDLNLPAIQVFTVVSMEHPPGRPAPDFHFPITYGVHIPRPYYEPDKDKCPLCILKQPSIDVKDIRDFSLTGTSQPTPFDFWEVVKDCKALVSNEAYAGGGMLLYRIETSRIFKQYGKWLEKIVARKYEITFGKVFPQVLVTLTEPAAKQFTSIVQRALKLYRASVISIERANLNAGTPFIEIDITEIRDKKHSVLIVDDGINKGETMRKLVSHCVDNELNILGALVFDNRLDTVQLNKISSKMKEGKILPVYSWNCKAS